MAKRVITIDFDDVVADFNTSFAAHHNNNFGTIVEYDDIHTHNLHIVYKLDQEECLSRIHHFLLHHHDLIQPIAGMKTEAEILKEYFELHIVTSRVSVLKQNTRSWLEDNAPNIFVDVHHVNTDIFDNRPKHEICRKLNAILHMDDMIHHAEGVTAHNMYGYLLNSPWNQGAVSDKVFRTFSWKNTVQRILENHA